MKVSIIYFENAFLIDDIDTVPASFMYNSKFHPKRVTKIVFIPGGRRKLKTKVVPKQILQLRNSALSKVSYEHIIVLDKWNEIKAS